jgi:nucleoside-triphosphatase
MTAGLKNILITGTPGVGKTTLVRKIFTDLKQLKPVGFYTGEIREGGIRKGFNLTSPDGRAGLLSHGDIKSPHRVGKYGIDTAGFERFLEFLDLLNPDNRLVIIDEIGKMECFSEKFRNLVRALLDSDRTVIATIALKGGGFIAEVKSRKDIVIHQLTFRNRDTLAADIVRSIEIP